MTSVGPVLHHGVHRVTMADVDGAGILYYASPYLWREELFTGWLAGIGHPLSGLLAAETVPPCITSSAQYLAPARLDDVLTLTLVTERLGRSSFDLRMDGFADERRVVAVQTRNVWCVRAPDGSLTATPLPGWLRSALSPAAPVNELA